MPSALSRLNRELFRLSPHDNQLILAVTVALTEAQESRSDPVLGITSDYLWSWYLDCISIDENHPNLDHLWPSQRAMQQALRRMMERGLLRGTVDPIVGSGPLLWRATTAGGRYLGDRRAFAYWVNGH
jgi:hypothetical protein